MHSTPDPSHVRFTGPLTPFASGLVLELVRLGYTSTSATVQMQLAAHLSRWLECQGMGPVDLEGPVIERFLVERRAVAGNLRVKEVAVAPGGRGDGDGGARAERFVVCHNPDQADRDAAVRARLVDHLEGLIAGSDEWTGRRRDELVGSLRGKPGLRRYLRRTGAGLLRIDAAAIQRESHLDGKWLLRTSDTTLTAEDLAAAYKQLLAVERGWRDMKGSLALRPVFHHREDRIRAHVQLCWLALLLIRVVENATHNTWRNTRHELDRMHLVTLATDQGQVAQRTATTAGQKTIWDALDLPEPARFHDFTPVGD